MTSLRNQTVVILGGTSGLGFAIALATLQSHASHVIIAASTSAHVSRIVDRLISTAKDHHLSGAVQGRTVEFTNEEQIDHFFAEIGDVDHVIIADNETFKPPPVQVSASTRVFGGGRNSLNGNGSGNHEYWGFGLVARQARIKTGGSICLTAGKNSALEGLTRGLAVDLAPAVRVNTIVPGSVLTDVWDGITPDLRDQLLTRSAEGVLLERLGTPEELAEAYLFAMKCGFLNGEIIHVNGGQKLA
ncbi:NAD(P)-binding protein [Sistotremastrum suecicum HHB10207 ss-3]|uniref:NAD(P)-binding protein n=1 Tax=Sistotremastrum suecicum HHB10207 ss-3 TaxID=1314776 RepID=A0A166CPV5_9AGAM|nr:NAD(P)-binding protein [Sistotremastrum suecicum HHB10207 ss-3]